MLTRNMEVDMLIDEIRRTPAKVLTEEQRESYWENGYLLLERLIPEEWLERLRAATDEMVERSRALTASDRVFDLEPDHTADAPRLRRVTSPVDQHPDYWAYARDSLLADVAADLVGTGRRVPPLEAQLQVGARRRRGQVAPGHPVLAAHQLHATDLRHVPVRLRHGAGAARGAARQPRAARSTTCTATTARGRGRSRTATPPGSTPSAPRTCPAPRAR